MCLVVCLEPTFVCWISRHRPAQGESAIIDAFGDSCSRHGLLRCRHLAFCESKAGAPPVPELVALDHPINLMDVGAAAIAEVPVYKSLLDLDIAHLNVFEGDPRHIEQLNDAYGKKISIYMEQNRRFMKPVPRAV